MDALRRDANSVARNRTNAREGTTMKAAVNYENGPPSVLRYEEVPDPTPGEREVLFRVEAISIEGGDLLNRRLTPPPTRPHIIGYQAAGTVVATGPGATRFKV